MPQTGRIRAGIGGWNYEPWRKTFYPSDVSKARELEYAAQAVTAIEINATFYKRQSPESYARWRDATPDGFQFTIKAHRACVSKRNLAEAGESIAWFLEGPGELGDRLGPIMWQFAPTRQFDREDMARFIDLLPASLGPRNLRHAIEPRHPSFADPAFFELAAARNVAVVVAEAPDYPRFDELTADFVYARLQCSRDELETGYPEAALKAWAAQAHGWSDSGRDAYLFFISGAKHRNPAAAQALLKLI